MFTRSFSLCLCALLIFSFGAAAQPVLSGPVSGYVFDTASRSLRPIMGLPGSSYLGDAVISEVDWAASAPDGRVALALRGGTLYAVRGLPSNVSWAALDGALARPERAAFNADASVAVVYSSTDGRLQWLRGLTDTPSAGAPVEIAGRVTALAMDRAGDVILAGTEGEQGGLYALTADAAPRRVAALGRPAGIALAANDQDLYVADAAGPQILEVRDFRSSGAVLPFAADSAPSEPVGLALSRDGRTLFVAGKSDRTLNAYDVASGTLTAQTALDFEPSFVEPLSGSALFLLKAAGQGQEPLEVLDAGLAPAVYFVPAGRGE